jgi:Polysaccharide pyruvyl transferase.
VEKKYDSRIYHFRKFIRKYIRLSVPCYDREDINDIIKDCTYLICGSDQIWNPMWYDPIYFLTFGSKHQKRIAYAPSGVIQDESDLLPLYNKMGRMINRIDYVSVREAVSSDILKRYTDKNIEAVLDPTLLLDQEDWDCVTTKRLIEEPYVFCYVMGKIREYKLIVKNVLKKHNAKKIVYIPSNLTEGSLPFAVPYQKAGPAEFISLIKNAEAICTDSFHGTALSVKYKKQFYILRRNQSYCYKWGNMERISNILSKLYIGERLVSCVKDVSKMSDIDYNEIDAYTNIEIQKSLNFLKEAFSNENSL